MNPQYSQHSDRPLVTALAPEEGAELPVIQSGVLADVLAHLALVLSDEAAALGLSPRLPDQLVGASVALEACGDPCFSLDELRRLLRFLGLPAAYTLPLIAEHASPFKGEAWDAAWSRVIAQLEALAADTAPAAGASPVRRAP